MEERHVLMFRRHLVVKRFTSTLYFCDYYFEGHTFLQILIHQGWKRVLSWTGYLYTLLVQEFYLVLQEVDTDADEWEIVIQGVQVKIFSYILSQYLGIQRRLGAYRTVEPSVVLPAKEIFQLIIGEYQYLIQSSVLQKFLPGFLHVIHLIFTQNIYPRLHHTECIDH